MNRSTQVTAPLIRRIVLVCFCTTSAFTQIRQIDSSKLPQDIAIQHAYKDLLPIDQFARTPEATWRFPVPKPEVESRFSSALKTLKKAQQQAPDNTELEIFTGLVAHLAYNLGIEEAYNPALYLLQSQANADFRAAWFLGIHQCQSNNPVAGMQLLLRVETSSNPPTGDFWQDYAICAGIVNMPVHAVRAYDKARKSPDAPPLDDQLEQIARDGIKPGSITSSYSTKQAWHEEKIPGGTRFTSSLCGISFATRVTSHLNVNLSDVAHGTCPVTFNTDQYPSRYGPSSASLLLVTQAARPGESLGAFSQRILETFSHGLLKDPREANRTPLAGFQCPVAICLSSEIITNKLYKSEGGAHLLAVFFQSGQPADPGLRFETPQPLPKVSNNSTQPEETPQRFDGALYTFVTLDANQDIYPRARPDFDDLLKSIVVDSK
jgi:hypothetical protein